MRSAYSCGGRTEWNLVQRNSSLRFDNRRLAVIRDLTKGDLNHRGAW